MDKRTFIKLIPGTVIALCGGGGRTSYGAGAARVAEDLPRWTRVVSLSVLQERLMRECARGLCSDEALSNLAGLTRVDGFVLDPANRDLLVVGAVEKDRPALHTADFVVALRSAAHKYVDSQRRYSYPGCSIDPDPQTMKKLLDLGGMLMGQKDQDEMRARAAWDKTCQLPQDVRVIGLGHDSRARVAAVFVSADYDMKRIVDSTDKVDGLATPSAVELAQAEASFKAGHAPKLKRGMSMSRYWFNAGANRFATDENAALLVQSDVQLSTEAQLLAGKGLADSAHRDVLADQCAADFTRLYRHIAATRSIYLELENLYRFQSVATALNKLDAFRRAGLNTDYLLDRYPVPVTEVPPKLPGRSAVKGFDYRIDRPNGYSIFKIRLPSCGGVSANVAEKLSLEPIRSTHLADMSRTAVASRPQTRLLFWDVGPGAAKRP